MSEQGDLTEEDGEACTAVDTTVTKANDLVRAAYRLTLQEQRVVLLAISKIDASAPLPRPVIVRASEFAQLYGLPMNQAYEGLKEAVDSLYDQDIKTFDGRHKDRFRWVDRVRYEAGGGEAALWFTPHIEPYLSKLNREITSYQTSRIASLNSVHSMRLFELLLSWRATGSYRVSVAEFRELLELGQSYERFNNLRQKVIEPAIEELRSKSGLQIELRLHKKGRSVDELEFTFSDQMSLGL